eukprot:TRINITY_DN2775_c0_g1_i2.p1 TRINITY_DN2775_c0_g1~~TRINITY_DN2775_c0_g1_i2.p1  ORF type:complete len:116 (-),score=23.48 TRINITY_DN2775_c0_g1_i2:58-405(-)
MIAFTIGMGGAFAIAAKRQKIPLGGLGIGLRALFYSTLLCATVSTGLVYVAKYSLGVNNIEEFGNYLRGKIKPVSEQLKHKMGTNDQPPNLMPATQEEINQLGDVLSAFSGEDDE